MEPKGKDDRRSTRIQKRTPAEENRLGVDLLYVSVGIDEKMGSSKRDTLQERLLDQPAPLVAMHRAALVAPD